MSGLPQSDDPLRPTPDLDQEIRLDPAHPEVLRRWAGWGYVFVGRGGRPMTMAQAAQDFWGHRNRPRTLAGSPPRRRKRLSRRQRRALGLPRWVP
jgi:hypothetical protein